VRSVSAAKVCGRDGEHYDRPRDDLWKVKARSRPKSMAHLYRLRAARRARIRALTGARPIKPTFTFNQVVVGSIPTGLTSKISSLSDIHPRA
jgi:hypothetical protein